LKNQEIGIIENYSSMTMSSRDCILEDNEDIRKLTNICINERIIAATYILIHDI
jgi:hypothetical protein